MSNTQLCIPNKVSSGLGFPREAYLREAVWPTLMFGVGGLFYFQQLEIKVWQDVSWRYAGT